MTDSIVLSMDERRLVREIIDAHLPPGTKVWIFGSRAKGRARRYSDLDLAVDAGRQLTIDETAALRDHFDECDLPYKVDLIDWHAAGARFRELIAAQRVPLNPAA